VVHWTHCHNAWAPECGGSPPLANAAQSLGTHTATLLNSKQTLPSGLQGWQMHCSLMNSNKKINFFGPGPLVAYQESRMRLISQGAVLCNDVNMLTTCQPGLAALSAIIISRCGTNKTCDRWTC